MFYYIIHFLKILYLKFRKNLNFKTQVIELENPSVGDRFLSIFV